MLGGVGGAQPACHGNGRELAFQISQSMEGLRLLLPCKPAPVSLPWLGTVLRRRTVPASNVLWNVYRSIFSTQRKTRCVEEHEM